ncbi:MAG: SDR family oxidoreductase [Candidatus Omnitrophica bacterium]|nr:SDR family oxidoreductase [Candidatus Omnitrophota bacterium]
METEKESLSMFSLKGKVALITGGRRGLGLAIATGFAKAGAHLAVVGRANDCKELAERISPTGARLLYLQADLEHREERQGLIPKVVEQYGKLDILVNCAGIQYRHAAIDFPLKEWDRLLSVMLTAVFELSQQAARVMINQKKGKIINIASLLSFQGGWTVVAYAAAKHGVLGLTRALANEWAHKGINVNAIAPGYFDTDMCAALKADPERERAIRERIPAGRWGKPEDLIGAAIFLASEAAEYINGQVLVVDGGWLSR